MIYLMSNVDWTDTTKPVYDNRGYTESKTVSQGYNDNFLDEATPTNTVKASFFCYETYDTTGIPERDANDNIV